MTKPITDLESRIDAAFARVDKNRAKKIRKPQSLGELREVPKLKPKIESAVFYFSQDQLTIMHDALDDWFPSLVKEHAPADMLKCMDNLLGKVFHATDIVDDKLLLDVNEFHLIAKAVEIFKLNTAKSSDAVAIAETLHNFFVEGKA